MRTPSVWSIIWLRPHGAGAAENKEGTAINLHFWSVY